MGGTPSDDDYDDITKHKAEGENSPQTPQTHLETIGNPTKRKKKMKKTTTTRSDIGEVGSSDDEPGLEGEFPEDESPRKRGKTSNGTSNGTVVKKRQSTDTELVNECEDKLNMDRNNVVSVSDLNYVGVGASTDALPHNVKRNIILVSSKENIRSMPQTPEQSHHPAVTGNRIKMDDNLCLMSVNTEDQELARAKEISNTSQTSVKSAVGECWTPTHNVGPFGGPGGSSASLEQQQKEFDSRVEMFRARSTDSLRRRAGDAPQQNGGVGGSVDSTPKKTKKKNKKNKKKSKESSDEVVAFECEQEEDSHNGKSPEDIAAGSNGALPPIRGASKLEPINLKGRLPMWNQKDS